MNKYIKTMIKPISHEVTKLFPGVKVALVYVTYRCIIILKFWFFSIYKKNDNKPDFSRCKKVNPVYQSSPGLRYISLHYLLKFLIFLKRLTSTQVQIMWNNLYLWLNTWFEIPCFGSNFSFSWYLLIRLHHRWNIQNIFEQVTFRMTTLSIFLIFENVITTLPVKKSWHSRHNISVWMTYFLFFDFQFL